jgi:hypothetical protein
MLVAKGRYHRSYWTTRERLWLGRSYAAPITPDAMDAILIRPVREQTPWCLELCRERLELCGSVTRQL